MSGRFRGDGICVAALALLALLFWGNCVFGGKVPVAAVYQQQMLPWSAVAALPESEPTRQWDSLLWDSMAQFYPWRLLLHRAGQQGEFPLWNPHQFCGYPFVGNGQSAMFYPPNWLYFALHPKLGMGLSAALHFLLGGLFVFGLARAWRLSRLPALFAALAFTYGGFTVTWIELPTLVNSLIWLPLAWWGIEVLRRKEGSGNTRPAVRGGIMLTVALSMTLLAGHLQIAAYVWIFTATYALIRLLPSRRLVPAVVAVALAGLLAMAQLLPTLELGGLSPRGSGGPSAAGFAFHKQRAVQPVELLTLFDPIFFGSPVTNDYQGISYSEHCGFVGAITVLLGLAGLAVGWRQGRVWLFAALAIFTLWGAMGGPPAALLYWGVPKLGQAGGFSRLLSVWTLAAALWGAMGLQALVERFGSRKEGPDTIRPAVAAAAVMLLAIQLLPWAYRFNPRAEAASVYPETEAIRQLRAAVGQDRYLAPVFSRQEWGLESTPRVVMPPNAATVYGLRSADGYDSLFPAAYRQYAAELERADPAPLANGNMILTVVPWRWTNAAVVNGIFETDLLVMPLGLKLWEGEGCTILHWYGQPTPVPWGRARLAFTAADGNAHSLPVPVAVDGLNRVRVDLSEQAMAQIPWRGAEVQLVDTFYPGWRAAVDGRPAGLAVHDTVFRKVAVTPANRRVDMVYFPASVVCGLFLSLMGLMMVVGMSMACRGYRGLVSAPTGDVSVGCEGGGDRP